MPTSVYWGIGRHTILSSDVGMEGLRRQNGIHAFLTGSFPEASNSEMLANGTYLSR